MGGFQLPDLAEEVYYVSFLDGTQRVLLFTTNMKVAEDCELAGDFEPIEQEITISIHGVGLSLVNNVTRSELLYLCIARYVIYTLICIISANCLLLLLTIFIV